MPLVAAQPQRRAECAAVAPDATAGQSRGGKDQYSPPVPVRTARSASGETPSGRPSASTTPIDE